MTQRVGDRLLLRWVTPAGVPFPMPVEIQAGGRIKLVEMIGNAGTLSVPPEAHVIVDPHNRVLMRSEAVEAMNAWNAAQAKAGAKNN